MARPTKDQLEKLEAFIDSLPAEARSKCALCNETLVHIVKQAEAQTGAGTSTVTRALSKKVNEGAAPEDRVSGEALRQKVIGKTTDKNLSVRNEQIKNKPEPKPAPKPSPASAPTHWTCKACGKSYPMDIDECQCSDKKEEKPSAWSDANNFADVAISQLSRIQKEDPKRVEALNRVKSWIETQIIQNGG